MDQMALRWGILSVGRISWDFVNAMGTLPATDHQVVAVAARDLNRAQEFAAKFDIPKAYDAYVKLAEDPDVEVVYIGSVSPLHFEMAKLMLEHGKHVLVEKPMCMNERQAKKLVEIAEREKLFLMEAIWSRFFPSYQYLRELIENGRLGDVKSIDIEFGFPIETPERPATKERGDGSVLALGIYNIQLVQWILQLTPQSINATGTLNVNGVDSDMQAEITYANDVIARISASSVAKLSNTAVIRGTKGEITLDEFWAPSALRDVDGTEKRWPSPTAKHEFNFPNSVGLRYEADEVRKCIRTNKLKSDNLSHDEILLIAHIETEIRKQIGVVYPEDE